MGHSSRDAALLALLVAAASWGTMAPSAAAAEDDSAASPVCVLSTDEVAGAVGVPIDRVDAVGLECAYSADPAQRAIQVVLSIVPPDPTALDPSEDGLLEARMDHPTGQDGTVADLPAWIASDGVWVDIGDDVLAVWLNALFDPDPPAMPDSAVAIAELAVPRYLANPRPSPTPRSAAGGILGRFPETLAGDALDVTELTGSDLFLQLDAFATGDQALGVADLRATIESMGVTLDEVQGGQAFAFDFDAGTNVTITGVRIPDQDVSVLLEPAVAAFSDPGSADPEIVTLAGRDVVHVAPPGADGTDHWLLADGDVLWVLDGDRSLAEAFFGALPAAGGAG